MKDLFTSEIRHCKIIVFILEKSTLKFKLYVPFLKNVNVTSKLEIPRTWTPVYKTRSN